MDGSMKEVKSKAEIQGFVASWAPVFVFFWKPLCLLFKKMGEEFYDFHTKFPHGYFLVVNVEEQPEICQAYSISSVPYFVYFEYIKRSLEDDFKAVVGVSPVLWMAFVVFLLLNVNGWQALFWASIIPVIVRNISL
ncbi:hypothetical protein CMV_027862 [Castanea mollissima]|uniref:Uncharacterized protein n=1 Tax=Castanea mollissima TaxID=60419 RepID=A0A8J4Q952_9ROSI|nr:hypothetical protein CMV_027862 [Castanea mollissima]